MIGVISHGRMGNQMFQLAFIYCAARKLRTSYFIAGADSLHYFNCYPALKNKNWRNIISYVLRNIARKSEHRFKYTGRQTLPKQIFFKVIFKNVFSWPNKLGEEDFFLEECRNNTLYSGFFQSEKYFLEYAEDVRRMFELSAEVQHAYSSINLPFREQNYVAVHLRRSDYLKYGGDELGGLNMTLPMSYYYRCLSLIEYSDSQPIVFVSDDIEFARSQFGLRPNYYFESNDEITDFQILLNASTIITANSTFSWWAAWLNGRKDKVVFAPDYFLGFKVKRDYPGGIRVNDWQWISVGGEYE